MELDLRALAKAERYKILASCITPRPIAWVTSRSPEGIINAAPYSFFNMVGDDPPTIALGLLAHADARLKDTAANVRATGEFVVNLVDEAHAAAMNLTCIDAPPDVDEIALAGLETIASSIVAPPRIAGLPAGFECRVLQFVPTGAHQTVVIAEVLVAHVADAFILDPARLNVDTPAMGLIGRLHGAGWYSRQTDTFQMTRPRWADRVPDGPPPRTEA